MSMDMANPKPSDSQFDQLRQENQQLRQQLQKLSMQQEMARGALLEAAGEKEATEKLAHQVTVEERATRAAVEVQASNISLSLVLHMLNFFLLLVLTVGLFFWLPRTIEEISRPATIVTPGIPGTAPTVIP